MDTERDDSDDVMALHPPSVITGQAKSEHSIEVFNHWGPAVKLATRVIWKCESEVVGTHDAPVAMSYLITGLVPNTRYEIIVYGRDGETLSSYARNVFATTQTVTSPPDAPSNLLASLTDNSIHVSWYDPGARASSFTISHGLTPNGPVIATETSYTRTLLIGGLQSLAEYYVDVRSFNSTGGSEPTRMVRATLTPPPFSGNRICAPGNLTGRRQTPTSVLLNWDEPYSTCNLCPDAKSFVIYGEGIATTTVAHSPWEITGLNPDREYRLSVRAKADEANLSEPSKIVVGVQPGVPRALQISDITAQTAQLTWLRPDGAVEIFDYLIYLKGEFHAAARGLTYLLTHLHAREAYTVEVRARTATSVVSAPLKGEFTTGEMPTSKEPRNLRVTANANRRVSIAWDPPVGFAPIGYRVSVALTNRDVTPPYDSLMNMIPGIPFVIAVRSRFADGTVSDPVLTLVIPRN